MIKSNSIILLVSMFLIVSCGSYETELIELKPEKTSESVHIGKGVWFKKPASYVRVKTYDGFQTKNNLSSVSVTTTALSIDQLKAKYEKGYLDKRGVDLLQLSPVKYGENESAFFSKVHDKKKKTIRYLLAINEGGQTYNIKGFCFKKVESTYGSLIKKALLSAYIGEEDFLEITELFKIAEVKDIDQIIFTKDTKYPTESEDGSEIEVKPIQVINEGHGREVIKKEMEKIIKKEGKGITNESLINGSYMHSIGENEERKALVALLYTKEGKSTLISCQGNEESSIQEFENFIRRKFLKTKIMGR